MLRAEMKTTEVKEKLDRHKAFWSRENHDRPLLAFTGSYEIEFYDTGIVDETTGERRFKLFKKVHE